MKYDRQYKKVMRLHKKTLKRINKAVSRLAASPIDYLIEVLKMLRDHYTLAQHIKNKDGTDNYMISSIVLALKQYDNYLHCAEKYYKFESGHLVKLVEGTDEEVAERFNKELNKSWLAFWTIVESLIGGWLENVGI